MVAVAAPVAISVAVPIEVGVPSCCWLLWLLCLFLLLFPLLPLCLWLWLLLLLSLILLLLLLLLLTAFSPIQELEKRYEHGLPRLDPVEDMNIAEPAVNSAVRRIEQLEQLLSTNEVFKVGYLLGCLLMRSSEVGYLLGCLLMRSSKVGYLLGCLLMESLR